MMNVFKTDVKYKGHELENTLVTLSLPNYDKTQFNFVGSNSGFSDFSQRSYNQLINAVKDFNRGCGNKAIR